jgi:hypothetical protein
MILVQQQYQRKRIFAFPRICIVDRDVRMSEICIVDRDVRMSKICIVDIDVRMSKMQGEGCLVYN